MLQSKSNLNWVRVLANSGVDSGKSRSGVVIILDGAEQPVLQPNTRSGCPLSAGYLLIWRRKLTADIGHSFANLTKEHISGLQSS